MTGKKGTNHYLNAVKNGLEKPISPLVGRIGKTPPPKTQEVLQKLRELAIAKCLGGVRQSKRILYNGKQLGSSYELAVAISLDENGIRWNTCGRFPYIDPNGKPRSYTPDLYLIDYDVYLDPKNDFLLENVNPRLGFTDIEKIRLVEAQNQIRVLTLDKYQLEWNVIRALL